MDKIEVLTLVNQNNESMGQFVKYEDYCKLQSNHEDLSNLSWNSYKDTKPPLNEKILILCNGNSIGPFVTTRIFEKESDFNSDDIYGWVTFQDFLKYNTELNISGYQLLTKGLKD